LRGRKDDDAQCARVQRWLEAAVAKQPDVTALLAHLGSLHGIRRHYAEAIACYRQVLDREPQNPLALNNLAWILALKEGRGEEALQLIERAMDVVGEIPELLDTRAMARLTLGQAELAAKDMEEAVAQAPSPSHYFHLARAQLAVDNRPAAEAAWRKAAALGLKPDPLERAAYQELQSQLE